RLLRAASQVLGSPQEPTGYVAGTDARLFPPAGIPAVVFGPGEFSEAHTADESISVDQLVQAARILTLLAADLLGGRPA
ncbi:MAG: M20/M25/M40 family metallo-hydrolase, partial [Nitrospinota bacterium]